MLSDVQIATLVFIGIFIFAAGLWFNEHIHGRD